MSLSTSNFRKGRKVLLACAFCLVLGNIIVQFLPGGEYKQQFVDSLGHFNEGPEQWDLVIFGDSRSTNMKAQFFPYKTLSLAAPNNTILFSYLLFKEMLKHKDFSPQFLVLNLGANNFNQNGIFPMRDFAVRRLSRWSDLVSYLSMPGGSEYFLDGFFSKIFPLYGRRVEIRTPSGLKQLLGNFNRRPYPQSPTWVPGMVKVPEQLESAKARRSDEADQNYYLIYKRSVYGNYENSQFHFFILSEMLRMAQERGIKVMVVSLPVEAKMRDLAEELIGDRFDAKLKSLQETFSFHFLDFRTIGGLDFEDLNHLSLLGHRDFARGYLIPALKSLEKLP